MLYWAMFGLLPEYFNGNQQEQWQQQLKRKPLQRLV